MKLNKMRVLFIGAIKFSLITLEELISLTVEIVGICGRTSSNFNSDHYDLSQIAKNNNIPFKNCKNINDEDSLTWMSNKKPDVIFCFGWSQILSKNILNLPPMGCIGYHPTKLPENRGRHPLIWALILGLKETGSTFFFLREGADSGDIISQKIIKISEKDDAKSLYKKVCFSAKLQIREFINNLENKTSETYSQESSNANYWRKRSSKDGLIDWRMGAETIHNLVRGLTRPYVGAEFIYKNKPFKVWKTKILKGNPQNIEPGKVLFSNKHSTIIKAGIDAIEVLEMEPTIVFEEGSYL